MPLAHHAPPPEQPRKKRQFQPAITSYFHTQHDSDIDLSDNDADDGHQRGGTRLRHIPKPPPHRPTLAPQVPDQVQSSLLSVGMRVRKSVPEGYKTPKTLPFLQTRTLRTPAPAANTNTSTMTIPVDALAATLQHQRELLPFCGLNKIGGYAEQPTTNPHLFGRVTNYFPLPAQAFSQPFGSQDSGYGTDAQRPKLGAGKRSWSDDEDSAPSGFSLSGTDFLFNIPTKMTGEEDIPVSPLSESPPPSLPPQRQYAQPKSRRHGRPTTEHVDTDMDYEPNALHEGTLAAGHASDFEEADFLHEHEVAMGGV